jgi:hypothetical protein
MSFFTYLFPRRPPIFYFFQLLQFLSALPSSLFLSDVFALAEAMFSVFGLIVLLIQWDPTPPPSTYVPRRMRRPPDKFSFWRILQTLLVIAALALEQRISNLSTSKQHHLRRRTSKQSVSKRHSFKLRGGVPGHPRYKVKFRWQKATRKNPVPAQARHGRQRHKLYARLAAFMSHADTDDGSTFDTDSYPIAVDAGASKCMTNNKGDFIGTPVQVHMDIHGLGRITATLKGTVRWSIEDDQGIVEHFDIPDTYYCPDLPIRLLSPQHWSQTTELQGAHSDVDAYRTTLEWGSRCKTIPLNASNVGILRTASGYKTSKPVISALNALLPSDLYCFETHVIPPDNDSKGEPTQSTNDAPAPEDADTMPPLSPDHDDEALDEKEIHVIDFQLEELSMEDDDEEATQQDHAHSKDPSAQLLHWHYRLGHLPFKTIQAMAHRGQLPSSLKNCKVPQCAACLYGKATKRPWRTRAAPNKVTPTVVNGPGDCVSVDQLISSTPGLIAQISGWLTRQRYTATTVFVDHYS